MEHCILSLASDCLMIHGDNIYDPGSLSLNHYVDPYIPFGYALCTHNFDALRHWGPAVPAVSSSSLPTYVEPMSFLFYLGKCTQHPVSFLLFPPPVLLLFPHGYVFHGLGSDSSTVTRAVNQTTLTFNAGKLHAK